MTSYTIKKGDILLLDISATKTAGDVGSVVTIGAYTSYSGGLCFNFNKDADVQKQIDKTVYIIRKPGVPVGYDIGLNERMWNITSTCKVTYGGGSDAKYGNGDFYNLRDLNFMVNFQYNRLLSGNPTYGILQLYYFGDDYNNTLAPVIVKSLWYEQKPGRGSLFDIRISLTEVVAPGA